jgi:uncharacterized membrane protein YkvA (DUF1232 family)
MPGSQPPLSSLSLASDDDLRPVRDASTVWETVVASARYVLQRRARVLFLVRDAYDRLTEHTGVLQGVRSDLGAMLRLTRAWARDRYQSVGWTSLFIVVAALVYFVLPTDLIPDLVAGLGFVDDAAVISAAVRAVHRELEAFRTWEGRRLSSAQPPPDHRESEG